MPVAGARELLRDDTPIYTHEDVEVERARRDFWHFARHLSTRDYERGEIRPFPIQFNYLHEYDDFLRSAPITLTLKSRRQYISNYHIALRVWRAWRTDKDASYSSGLLADGLRTAKDLLKRAANMIESLPAHFRDYNPSVATIQQIQFAHGGSIVAYPATENPGRGFGFTDALCDEMAFWPWARSMWAALRFTTQHIDIVSTPNGPYNLFAELWHDKNKYPGIARTFLHYSDHPEHSESEWIDSMKATMDDQTWDREMEGSFATMAGARVYGGFNRKTHVVDYDQVPEGVVYESWDFGFRHPAVIWAFRSNNDQLVIDRELMGEDVDIRRFTDQVLEHREANYPGCSFRVFADVAGNQRQSLAQKDAQTDIDVLRSRGVRPQSKRHSVRDTINLVTSLLRLRSDGRPGLIVHPRCETLISGFLGGYCWDDKESDERPREKPKEDGYYEHEHDCLRYMVGFLFGELTGDGSHIRKPRKKLSFSDRNRDPGFAM